MMSRSERLEKYEKEEAIKKEQEKKQERKKLIIKLVLCFLVFLTFLILYMHFIGTKGLVVREYKVESENLPKSFHGFKVAHFSDLHYLTTVNKKELRKVVNKINELRADIVVFTGDLVDSNQQPTDDDINYLMKYLSKIEATIGLYAIKGNHDYSNDYFEKIFNETNFKILDNSYEYIYYNDIEPIIINGINSSIQNELAFNYKEKDLYTITLLHEPDIIDDVLYNNNVDLALAGHSHNGQIRLPGIGSLMTVEGGKKYPNEKYKINDTNLFVSGGIGTSIYEFRLFNRPSINLYRLVTE